MKKKTDHQNIKEVNRLLNYFACAMVYGIEIPTSFSTSIVKNIAKVIGEEPNELMSKLQNYYQENKIDIETDISNCGCGERMLDKSYIKCYDSKSVEWGVTTTSGSGGGRFGKKL